MELCSNRLQIVIKKNTITHNVIVFSSDLRQELAVKEREKFKFTPGLLTDDKENKEPDRTLATPTKSEVPPQTPESVNNLSTTSIGTSPLHTAYGSSPLTPSARISALNIVGDLLRKVGVSRAQFVELIKDILVFWYMYVMYMYDTN